MIDTMWRWGVAAVLATSGCSFFLDDRGDGDPEVDAGDGDVELPDGGAGYQPWRFDVEPERLTGRWTMTTTCNVNTTSRQLDDNCAFAGQESVTAGDVFTLWADEVTINATLRVDGDRPLAIVAHTITLTGAINADGRRLGIDMSPSYCTPDLDGTGTTAGGGGGFGARGQPGGAGGGLGGKFGQPVSLDNLPGVSIGCPGGVTDDNAEAARGGGAVQLIALTSLAVDGEIFVHGAGGEGGGTNPLSGAGGGGSGGMIVLDSPSIELGSGTALGANGGSGGAGSAGGLGGANSTTGASFECTTPGMGPPDGGEGGCDPANGNRIEAMPGDPAVNPGDSGGGGGGGVGFILYNGDLPELSSVKVSPLPEAAP